MRICNFFTYLQKYDFEKKSNMFCWYFNERSNELMFEPSVPSVASHVGRRKVQGCSPSSNLEVDVFQDFSNTIFLERNVYGRFLPGEVTELILATFSG